MSPPPVGVEVLDEVPAAFSPPSPELFVELVRVGEEVVTTCGGGESLVASKLAGLPPPLPTGAEDEEEEAPSPVASALLVIVEGATGEVALPLASLGARGGALFRLLESSPDENEL